MAKYIKKKKKKLNKLFIYFIIMCLSFVTYAFCCVNVGSKNINLQIDIQNKKALIKEIKEENKKLQTEIAILTSKDMIYSAAKEAGLEQNQDNVIIIDNN